MFNLTKASSCNQIEFQVLTLLCFLIILYLLWNSKAIKNCAKYFIFSDTLSFSYYYKLNRNIAAGSVRIFLTGWWTLCRCVVVHLPPKLDLVVLASTRKVHSILTRTWDNIANMGTMHDCSLCLQINKYSFTAMSKLWFERGANVGVDFKLKFLTSFPVTCRPFWVTIPLQVLT